MKYLFTFESFNLRDNNKAVNTDGAPLTFYRADHFERTVFDESSYSSTPGMYFTTEKDYAESYGPFITVAQLLLTNPLIVQDVNSITDWNFDYEDLKDSGYDGLMYTDTESGETLAYTFDHSQVHVLSQYEQ